MTPQEIVQFVLGPSLVPGKRYPEPLPAELEPWLCYTVDGGFCILVALGSSSSAATVADELLPAPVRSVLRGYELRGGYVVVDLEYDPDLGLVTSPEDDEY